MMAITRQYFNALHSRDDRLRECSRRACTFEPITHMPMYQSDTTDVLSLEQLIHNFPVENVKGLIKLSPKPAILHRH